MNGNFIQHKCKTHVAYNGVRKMWDGVRLTWRGDRKWGKFNVKRKQLKNRENIDRGTHRQRKNIMLDSMQSRTRKFEKLETKRA